ncbi:hypothetical protein [Methylocucumis oryzae]|uniref:Uncharacterized protein n=1 Tax=Methylocucumis oryzae TaxID=1632867 RepID=A0A0F3IM58_9GAMM|nr:hypothetical protein [Methylocucumis oryzae]KJV06639.1 hypothetical protein VZ94_09820 [Methylocucumis oryzae]
MIQKYQQGVDACIKAIQIDASFQLAKNNLAWAVSERDKVVAVILEQEKSCARQAHGKFLF